MEIKEPVIQLIVEKINDVKDDIKKFHDDADVKIDHVKDDFKTAVGQIKEIFNDKITILEKKIDSIEKKNNRIDENSFQIRTLKKNVDDLAEKTRGDREELEKALNDHCVHHEELIAQKINDTIKTFKASVFTKFIAGFASALSVILIGVVTGIFEKIGNFITRIWP